MTGPKLNEREGTRAVLRGSGGSAYKMRQVLDLIRNQPVGRAKDILRFSDRALAVEVGKLLASAVANAENNDNLDAEELYVSACYADEGRTQKRFRPRARGRASRIRKRSSSATIIVSRLPEDRLARLRAKEELTNVSSRRRRVERGRVKEKGQGASPPMQPTAETTDAGIITNETTLADTPDAESAVDKTVVAETPEAEAEVAEVESNEDKEGN